MFVCLCARRGGGRMCVWGCMGGSVCVHVGGGAVCVGGVVWCVYVWGRGSVCVCVCVCACGG